MNYQAVIFRSFIICAADICVSSYGDFPPCVPQILAFLHDTLFLTDGCFCSGNFILSLWTFQMNLLQMVSGRRWGYGPW
jgi:hypothetical protein